MRVVLGKTTHTQKAMQNACLLLTVYGPQFEITNGQFTVGTAMGFINENVPRAVHGFNHIIFLITLK